MAKEEVVPEVAPEVVTEEVAPVVAEEAPVVEKPSKGKKFYRTRLNGLTIILGNHKALDPDELERVRFTTKLELFQGDKVKVGYLATDDKRAHKILEADYNVEEIEEKEYNKAMEAK
jgi:hypothetical protein